MSQEQEATSREIAENFSGADPRSMALLLTCGGGGEAMWRAHELESVMRHQLDARLSFGAVSCGTGTSGFSGGAHGVAGAGSFDEGAGEGSEAPHPTDDAGQPIRSFRELFKHPRPPLELLLLTKEFAKNSRSGMQGLLPQEVATVMYYAAILAARLRLGSRISALDDRAMLQGIDWVLNQSWVDDQTCALFREAHVAIDSGAWR